MTTRYDVIGLIGKSGAGKDTAASALVTDLRFENLKFAGPLKEMLRALLRYQRVPPAEIERMLEGDLKETPSPHLGGKTPRVAMATLGTEWGRNQISPSLWIEAVRARVTMGARVVFTDCRFENEARVIRSMGGVLIRIVRPSLAKTSAHRSETEQDKIRADVTMINDTAAPEQFAEIMRLHVVSKLRA